MRRREFIAGTAATAALDLARPAFAQTDVRSPIIKRVAIVSLAEKPEEMTVNGRRTFKGYFSELRRLGYIEGQNLIVERYSGLGQPERYGEVARTVVGTHPDLIVAVSGPITRELMPLTSVIPIISTGGDPVAGGIVTNLARPDGNITGVSSDIGVDVWGKRLQLLVETIRQPKKLRLLIGTTSAKFLEKVIAPLQEAATRAGISVTVADVTGKFDKVAYEQAFDTLAQDRVDGLLLSDASEHITNRQLIVDLAAKYRLPTVYPFREFADVGGLLAYGVDLGDVGRRLADMTDQVLRGAKPGDIPFYQETKFELVLNRTTAKSLGLEFPATLLAVADEVIG
jgi:putative tryptophan/tyrosine transport system substrate-binding protein